MKHAKKSLLIPILALFSVIAIIAGCYLVQAVTAHADGEVVEAAAVETSEVGVPAPGAEDPENLGEAEPNPVSELKDITARISLSTNDVFRYAVTESHSVQPTLADERVAGFGEITATGHNVIYVENYLSTYADTAEEINGQQYVPLCGFSTTYPYEVGPCYWINVTSFFYKYSGLSLTYDISGKNAEISLTMSSAYYIKFDANGGKVGDYDKGELGDGADSVGYQQGENNYLFAPASYDLEGPDDKKFSGWYTHPVWGERIDNFSGTVPGGGEIFVLYAHGRDNDEPITFNITTGGFGQVFEGEYYNYDDGTLETGRDGSLKKVVDPDDDQYIPFSEGYYFQPFVDEDTGKLCIYLEWGDDNENDYYGYDIKPVDGMRISSVSINGGSVNLGDYYTGAGYGTTQDFPVAQTNNVVINFEGAIPGYLSIASDNGSMFKVVERSSGNESYTDYFSLYVDPYEYIEYHYGDYMPKIKLYGAVADDNYNNSSGASFTIMIHNYKNPSAGRVYTFQNVIFSIFDWFEMNSYIHGVDIDGYDIPIGSGYFPLDNGYHAITIKMSDKDFDTTVTYDANGGHFADDSTSMTVDATYGEPLPVVEVPKAIDNDFVGWFTEPEGGVQVDPEHFIWMPWQRETGVTLYAHWAYNPQPVPPEPVPPTPPEPVNPDVPGGGGTAQTGDSMPLVPIAALAVIAALGCGLAIRKETSK